MKIKRLTFKEKMMKTIKGKKKKEKKEMEGQKVKRKGKESMDK